MSFTNAFLINPTPEMIEQITGRTGNRWDFSVIGKLYIVLDYRKTELFIYKETNSWEKYYSKYIEHLRSKINNAPISTFDLKNIRINFFEKNSDKQISYKRIVQNNLRKGLELLSKIVFTDGSYIGTQELDSKHIKDGADVRGDALTRFFAIQIEGEPFGVLSGPINIPSYRFGGEDFINLYNGDIIANIKRYFRDNSDIAKKYNIKLATCCEKIDLEKYGIEHNSCIDGKLIEELFNITIDSAYHLPNTSRNASMPITSTTGKLIVRNTLK
jgi:hypothetical protein